MKTLLQKLHCLLTLRVLTAGVLVFMFCFHVSIGHHHVLCEGLAPATECGCGHDHLSAGQGSSHNDVCQSVCGCSFDSNHVLEQLSQNLAAHEPFSFLPVTHIIACSVCSSEVFALPRINDPPPILTQFNPISNHFSEGCCILRC